MTDTSKHTNDRPGLGEAPIDWRVALNENRAWMRTVIRCRISNKHAVDDLMQEIALAVLKQDSRPPTSEKVAPWLYQLIIRHAATFQRQSGRQKRLINGFAQHNSALGESLECAPLKWLLVCEQRDAVASVTDELAPEDREILVLKYTEGWTYAQLAQHMGESVNTIEYRLVRAKRLLRQNSVKRLQWRCHDELC